VKYSGNEVRALHYKHGANGRPTGWQFLLWNENGSVLKHSQAVRQVGSSMKSALIHTLSWHGLKCRRQCVNNYGCARHWRA